MVWTEVFGGTFRLEQYGKVGYPRHADDQIGRLKLVREKLYFMGSVAAETSDFRRTEVAGQYQQCPVGMTLMGSNGRLWSAASEGLDRYRVDSPEHQLRTLSPIQLLPGCR